MNTGTNPARPPRKKEQFRTNKRKKIIQGGDIIIKLIVGGIAFIAVLILLFK